MQRKVTLAQITWSFSMYKYSLIILGFLSSLIGSQEIPDYKGDYVFTNSRVTMQGIRELSSKKETNERTIQFNAKFPLGRIKIISDFTEADNQIASTKYNVDVKWTLISDKRVLTFDQAKNTLTSAGKFKWESSLLANENVFDPLNVQIQIRKNVIAGLTEFSLMLPDLKTGAIEPNNYKVVGEGSYQVEGVDYPCVVVERIRTQDDRTTRYFLAPELDYLIIKVEDQDEDGDTMLELKKLY